jgi:hypothetical protein
MIDNKKPPLKEKTVKIDYSKFDLTFSEIDELLSSIETIKRRKIIDKGIITYVDPFGHVSNLKKPVNHLIIGRRGSGKTSLLIKIRETLESDGNVLSFIDLQSKRHDESSTILILILKSILNEIIKVVDNNPEPSNLLSQTKKNLKFKLLEYLKFNKKDKYQVFNLTQKQSIYYLAKFLFKELETIAQIKSGTIIKRSSISEKSTSKSKKFNLQNTSEIDFSHIPILRNKTEFKIEGDYQKTDQTKTTENIDTTEEYSQNVALKELQPDIIELLNIFNQEVKRTIYIFLDDFYQISIINQPHIFNFLHELSKETTTGTFSFNVCLVPNRYKLNFEGEKILSQLNDFSTINLDRDFDDLEANKDILMKILCGINPKIKLNPQLILKLFTDTNVLNHLVLASGALPRIFLDLLAFMIKVSKAENERKITMNVYHQGVKNLRRIKDELIPEEADLSEEIIVELTKIIDSEIVREKKTNFILYPKDKFDKHEKVLVTLFNIGYLHRVKEEEKNLKGIFVPIMLDMTFTHGSKTLPQGFSVIKFWDKKKYKSTECVIWSFNDAMIDRVKEQVTIN